MTSRTVKPLTIPALPPPHAASPTADDVSASALFASAVGPEPDAHDLSGLDLLGPAFEAPRLVLTRTLLSVRPDVYAAYRQIKDGHAADAREQA